MTAKYPANPPSTGWVFAVVPRTARPQPNLTYNRSP